MDTTLVIIVIIVVVLVAAAAAVVGYGRRRTAHLQERFGPEYERTLKESGGQHAAERDLRDREARRDELEIVPLSGEAAARYRQEWAGIQQLFVDQPAEAVHQADGLVVRMMRDSGYPVDHFDDFDRRADDISVDHPEVAQHYRAAHAVAVAQLNGGVDTEQQRQAVTSYRELVDALVRDSGSSDGTPSWESTASPTSARTQDSSATWE